MEVSWRWRKGQEGFGSEGGAEPGSSFEVLWLCQVQLWAPSCRGRKGWETGAGKDGMESWAGKDGKMGWKGWKGRAGKMGLEGTG